MKNNFNDIGCDICFRFAYGTTKAAVIGLSKSLAADLVGAGVV